MTRHKTIGVSAQHPLSVITVLAFSCSAIFYKTRFIRLVMALEPRLVPREWIVKKHWLLSSQGFPYSLWLWLSPSFTTSLPLHRDVTSVLKVISHVKEVLVTHHV